MIEEGSAEWFAARAGSVTCSILSDIMSNGRKAGEFGQAYYRQLDIKTWEIVSGSIAPSFAGSAAQRGLDLEPQAGERYEAHTGRLLMKPGLLQHSVISRFRGTPDFLTLSPPVRCVQVKCPMSPEKITALRADRNVDEYFAQVQGEMLIVGAQVCDLVVYDDRLPPPYDLLVIEVEADREYQAKMLDRVGKFLADLDARVLAFKAAA